MLKKKCNTCGVEKAYWNYKYSELHGLRDYCKECFDSGKAEMSSEELGHKIYMSLKNSSKKRGLSLDLTEDELVRWFGDTKDECYYCGITPWVYTKRRSTVLSYYGDDDRINRFKRFFSSSMSKTDRMTIDRMDNSEGYSIDNIVKACWVCNCLKGSFFTSDEFLSVANIVNVNNLPYIPKPITVEIPKPKPNPPNPFINLTQSEATESVRRYLEENPRQYERYKNGKQYARSGATHDALKIYMTSEYVRSCSQEYFLGKEHSVIFNKVYDLVKQAFVEIIDKESALTAPSSQPIPQSSS